MVSLTFLMTALVIVATPGTGAIDAIVAGLSRGKTAGIFSVGMRHFIFKKPKVPNIIRPSLALTFAALSAKWAMTSRSLS